MKLDMKAHMVLEAIAIVEGELELPKKQQTERHSTNEKLKVQNIKQMVERLPGNVTITLEQEDIFLLRAGLRRAFEAEKERYQRELNELGKRLHEEH